MRLVALRCPSETWGHAIDASGALRVRCTGKRCRRDGQAVIHTFDLASGDCRTVEDILGREDPAVRDKELTHAGHAAI